MATLNIWDYFQLDSQGAVKTGKQGEAADAPQTPMPITVTGTTLHFSGLLESDNAFSVWEKHTSSPEEWDFFWIVGDQDFYVQLIDEGGGGIIFKVLAMVPFKVCHDLMLAGASQTSLSASAPTLLDIETIRIGNYNETSLTYTCVIVD